MPGPKTAQPTRNRPRNLAKGPEPSERDTGLADAANPVLFVSYSRSDTKYVKGAQPHLRNAAESCGFELFLDEVDLRAGDSWQKVIEAKLTSARAAVVFLSNHYLDKGRFASTELLAILNRHQLGKLTCFVVPVSEVDPHRPKEYEGLFEIHWALPSDRPIAAMGEKDRQQAFRKLNDVIGKRLKGSVAEPQTLEEFAENEVLRTLDRKYQILEFLGTGKSSVVFRAQDTALNRDVAIKVLVHARYQVHIANDFIECAKFAAGLQHPNIAQVFTSQLQSSPYYMVSECIVGPTLDMALKQNGALDAHAAVQCFDQLASALALYHQRQTYHGAIRPSNILVDKARRDMRCVLTVHWRRASKNGGRDGLTFEELTYLTPEQYFGGEIDAKTDQYQLGQLLYELLTGEPPARVNVLADFQKKQVSFTAPVSSWLVGSSFPDFPGFPDALARMLNADPDKRWPSIEEARQAVRQAVNGINPKRQAARASFDRCVSDTKFFPSIYDQLFELRSDLKRVFQSRNTPFERQHVRLRAALVLLFEGTATALRTIDDYGQQHAEMDIKRDDYDSFLEAIVRAARASEGDAWNDDLEDAWRTSLAPGIDRMKRAARA